jgi:hypothetical protein
MSMMSVIELYICLVLYMSCVHHGVWVSEIAIAFYDDLYVFFVSGIEYSRCLSYVI